MKIPTNSDEAVGTPDLPTGMATVETKHLLALPRLAGILDFRQSGLMELGSRDGLCKRLVQEGALS